MPRVFSTDVPDRNPRRRRGTLKARRTANLYLMDFGTGQEWAYYGGDAALDLGTDHTATFDPVTDQWVLPAAGSPPYWDVTFTDVEYLDYDTAFFVPAASRAGGYVQYAHAGTTWANIHSGGGGGSYFGGTGGAPPIGVGLVAGAAGTWAGLRRGIIQFAFGALPEGSVIKRAELIGYPNTNWNGPSGNGGLPGMQIGWVQSNKPTDHAYLGFSDIKVSTGDDWTNAGDTLDPLLTDLLAVDSFPESDFGSDWDNTVRMPAATWTFTAAGVAYLQDCFDNPATPAERKVQLKMLSEWDRTNTPPTWVAAQAMFMLANARYVSDDGHIAPPIRIRCYL